MPSYSRNEAVSSARKLLRGFSGAPDLRQHAHRLHSELAHGEGWSATERQEILALGAWLQTRPPVQSLKAHCAATLAKLG